MGKALQNKLKKRTALLDSAYELFTTMGFNHTTIRDIASKAGVAKGTFYLYFKDKTDIRDALIRAKASQLLQNACRSMDNYKKNSAEMDVADKFIYIIDYIVDNIARDVLFAKFISKHLSWGLFANGQRTPHEYYGLAEENSAPLIDFEDYINRMLDADNVKIRDLKVLLFTLLEMVSSMSYDLILYKQPMPLEEFKPYLNHSIRLLVNDSIIE